MYSFRHVLRRSLRNEQKDIWYSEADAQALYKLIQKYNKYLDEKRIEFWLGARIWQ